MRNPLHIILLLILFYVPALGADLTVSPSGAGSKNGSDWDNPLDWSALTSTSLVRGNTYYLADGSYSNGSYRQLGTAASGATRITIKKATVATHGPAGGWLDSMGDGQAVFTGQFYISTSYWTIDGVSRTTDSSGYGIKVIGGTGNNIYCIATGASDTTNGITIQYVELTSPNIPITNCCVNSNLCPSTGLYVPNSTTDFVVNYSYIHDVGNPILMNGSTGFIIGYSRLERNDSPLDGTCTPPTPSHHSEAFSFNGGTNMTIRNNKMIDIEGTAHIAFMNGGDPDNVLIYNNITYLTTGASQGGTGNGWITCTNAGTVCTNFNIYGNTIVNIPAISASVNIGSGGSASNWNVKNNLWFCNTADCGTAVNSTGTGFVYDDNWYGGVTHNESENGYISGGAENPFTDSANYDFTLKAGATPIDNGTTLGSPYDTDYLGNTRSTFDIGAYEYGGADATPSAFSFTSVTGAALSTVTTTSPCVTVAGITAGQTPAVSISGTGCTFNVDGGAYGSDNTTAGLDNVICLRVTSSGSYSTTANASVPDCTLTIGGVSAGWNVTTQAAVENPAAPRHRGHGRWRWR